MYIPETQKVNPSPSSNFKQNGVIVLRVVRMKNAVFLDMTLCSVVEICRLFQEFCSLFSLEDGDSFSQTSAKSTRLHSATSTRQHSSNGGYFLEPKYMNVSDPIRETNLLQRTFRTAVDALVIAVSVGHASVWESSGPMFRGGNAVRLLGVRAPELEGCPLCRNPCNGEQEKTAD